MAYGENTTEKENIEGERQKEIKRYRENGADSEI